MAGTTKTFGAAALKSSNVASASTCDIGATTTAIVRITGTTTITSLGTVANKLRFVTFAAALTLTYNATTLILPGAANIVTAAGDTATFLSDASGNWTCLAYQRAAIPPAPGNGQIAFPATQNSSADVNTLDDYEEGTFTAGLAFGGASTGITYTTQSGVYTKIGNVVFFSINLLLSNKGSATGAPTLTGLPFASSSFPFSVSITPLAGFTGLTAGLTGFVVNGSTTISLRAPSTTGSSAINDTNFSNTSNLYATGFYRV